MKHNSLLHLKAVNYWSKLHLKKKVLNVKLALKCVVLRKRRLHFYNSKHFVFVQCTWSYSH